MLIEKAGFSFPEIGHRSTSEAVPLIRIAQQGHVSSKVAEPVIHLDCSQEEITVIIAIG